MGNAEERLNATPTQGSLRAELGGGSDPSFQLALPAGWVKREVSDAERDELTAAMRGRLMQANRPELFARMRPLMIEAFRGMAEADVVAFYTPGTGVEDALALPASMTATIRRAAPGETLDALITGLIRTEGATALLGDKRFLRCERNGEHTMDGERVAVTQIVYLTPVPGSGRRRALQFVVTILRPWDVPIDDLPLTMMRALFDLSVSSLIWIPAPE